MAKIVEFGLLEPGATYWQEFRCGSYVIPCKVLSRADESHVMMRFGTECPWVQDVKADSCFRYWDEMPTNITKPDAIRRAE